MSNMSLASGIALMILVMATIASVVSIATNHWEDIKIRDIDLPGVNSKYPVGTGPFIFQIFP